MSKFLQLFPRRHHTTRRSSPTRRNGTHANLPRNVTSDARREAYKSRRRTMNRTIRTSRNNPLIAKSNVIRLLTLIRRVSLRRALRRRRTRSTTPNKHDARRRDTRATRRNANYMRPPRKTASRPTTSLNTHRTNRATRRRKGRRRLHKPTRLGRPLLRGRFNRMTKRTSRNTKYSGLRHR